MNIPFENLAKIDTIIELLKQLPSKQFEKRWLSTLELAEYTGYSTDSINKFVTNDELLLGTHFYQKSKKRLFDKNKIDEWIISSKTRKEIFDVVDEIVSSIKKD